MAVLAQIKQAWNAFRSNGENIYAAEQNVGPSYSTSQSRPRLRFSNDKTIISSIYNRISIDVAGVEIRHVALDVNRRYSDDIKSAFGQCLTLEPNIDQGPRAFRQDIVSTLFDYGVAAIVPVDTAANPAVNAVFDIYSMRVGNIIQWYPRHVKINLYNETKGKREEVLLEKRFVAIVENPMYSVMNETNSTLQRLIRKLQLLDVVDEQSGSGKLDLIIQLPYVIKSEARKAQAEQRRADIEFQLKGSQYGIAYTDGTEKITQLNRPTENNLMKQVENLTVMLYGQLGLTEEIMNGTADEKVMLNYFNRTVEPILDAIVEAMQRAFLGILGTEAMEKVLYFRDPFKFVPLGALSDVVDKLSRNEILTPNEIRSFMGVPPSKEPKADQLQNSNMPLNPANTQPQLPLGRNSQNGT